MTLEILHDDTALLKFKPHRISHQLEVELAITIHKDGISK